MKDILVDILNLIKSDAYAHSLIKENVWIMNYPNPTDMKVPYIVLDELAEPMPVEYASNDNMGLSYLVTVDVFVPSSSKTNSYYTCRDLSYHISRLLFEEYGLKNTASSKPEYDEEVRMYRRSRTYKNAYYRKDLNIDGRTKQEL